MFFDSHAHLNNKEFKNNIEKELEFSKKAHVTKILVAGYDMESSEKAVEYSKKYENIYSSVGIHPHDAKTFNDNMLTIFSKMLKEKRVVAVGEIGLDYCKEYSPKNIQIEVFKKQLLFAKEKNLPVIIHSRDASNETFEILKEIGHYKGVLHCFSSSLELADKYCELGFYISLSGTVTFKNAKKAVRVAEKIDINKLLIETDCPYLAPVPYRGKTNRSAYVVEVAKKIASLKKISIEEIAHITYKNTINCFGIN